MTYREAKAQGYEIAFSTYQRGYVSRKVNLDDQQVLEAGGNRRGMLYVLGPATDTTRYCLRHYLKVKKAPP